MKIKLHIGTHKTGTTSIQRYFRKNENALRENKIWYPNFDVIGKNKRYAHHELAHSIAGKSKNLTFDQSKKFLDRIKETAFSDEEVFISAEPFYRHVIGETSKAAIWRNKETYVQRVRDFFAETEVEIILVLRRQDYFAASLYQENVKANRYSRKFDSFIKEFYVYFDYLRNIQLWEKYFENVKILIFEDLSSNRSLEKAFAEQIGVTDFKNFNSAPKVNESLPTHLIEFKRLINGSPLKKETIDAIKQRLMDKEGIRDLSLDASNTYWLDQVSRKNFLDSFNISNDHVLKKYTSLERNSLFPAVDVPAYEKYAGMSEELYLELLKRVLLK